MDNFIDVISHFRSCFSYIFVNYEIFEFVYSFHWVFDTKVISKLKIKKYIQDAFRDRNFQLGNYVCANVNYFSPLLLSPFIFLNFKLFIFFCFSRVFSFRFIICLFIYNYFSIIYLVIPFPNLFVLICFFLLLLFPLLFSFMLTFL